MPILNTCDDMPTYHCKIVCSPNNSTHKSSLNVFRKEHIKIDSLMNKHTFERIFPSKSTT